MPLILLKKFANVHIENSFPAHFAGKWEGISPPQTQTNGEQSSLPLPHTNLPAIRATNGEEIKPCLTVSVSYVNLMKPRPG